MYGLILLQVGLFYLASGLVLPDLRPEAIDLEADYFRNRRWFFSLLAAAALVSICKDLVPSLALFVGYIALLFARL